MRGKPAKRQMCLPRSCCIACIRVILVLPCFSVAQSPAAASGPAPATASGTTTPSDDVLAPADALLDAASNLQDASESEKALAKYREASELYKKLQGSEQTTEHAACSNGQGMCLMELDRANDALPLFKSALAICQQLHKDQDDSDVAVAMMHLANCLATLGENEDALPINQAALEMRRRLSKGEDEPEVAASMGAVAARLAALGRNDDALPFYQQCLEMRQRLHKGEDDADVATSYFDLGSCLQDLGRTDDALKNFQASLQMKQHLAKGADDSDVATTENSVAFCLYGLGRYNDALPVFQDTLEMRRRIYKDEDAMDVIVSMNNVAKCLDSLGRSTDALALYQSALESTRRICKNQDSAELAVVIDNVAACMESLGRGDDALPMFQSALEMRRRIYKGADDTDVASSLNDLATCEAFLGRSREALANFQGAHDMLVRINKGQDSVEVATALANIASCLDQLGRSAGALSNHEAALEMRRRLYKDADHPDIAISLGNEASCLTSLGRFADALPENQAALEMWKRIYKDADHPSVAKGLTDVALSMDNLKRSAEALPLYMQALAMRRRLNGNQDHPDIAVNLALTAGCLMGLDRPAEALPYSREALEMNQRVYRGHDHPLVAWNMAKVASCLAAVKKPAEAAAMYQGAVAMAERLSDPELYSYSSDLGDLLLAMGKLEPAAAAYDKSINAFERARAALGGDDLDRMKFMDAQESDCDALVAVVRVQIQLNHPDKAAEYLDRGRARSLLDVLERGERQAGGDLLGPLKANAEATHDTQTLQQLELAGKDIATLDARHSELTSQIDFARSLNSDDGYAQIVQLQPKLDEACRQYTAAHRRLFDLVGTTTLTAPASAAQMQSLLKPHQHLLMYSITDRDVALIVIPPPGEPIAGMLLSDPDQMKPLSGVALERLIVGYQQAVVQHSQDYTRGLKIVPGDSTASATDNMTRNGNDLFRRLVPPAVWQQIKDDELVFLIPDPGMNGLPLETLIVKEPSSPNPKDCQYWLDQGPAISYGASATALLKLCAQPSAARTSYAHQAVLLGDPVLQREARDLDQPSSDAGQTRNASLGEFGLLTPLPGTRKEIMGIFQQLTGYAYAGKPDDSVVVLLGEDATSKRLAEAVTGTRYLHLATHGLARSGPDAIYSSVVLTQPRVVNAGDTGLLTLEDLFDHWGGKLVGTELVVLSACDSQGIDQTKSNAVTDEGVFGLPWGFWYAGCPTVVASLWEVQDQSTAKLMEDFYRELQSSKSPSKLAAFTTARKQLRREYPAPFFWAPFIYLGNPN